MSDLKDCRTYWVSNFKDAKERFEMISSVSAFVLGLILVGLEWFNIGSQGLKEFLNSGAADWAEGIAFSYALLAFFVWIPFKRAKREKTTHDEMKAQYEERDRAKLIISYDDKNDGNHTRDIGASHHMIRLAVTLKWTQPAPGCFGNLMKIEKDGVVVRDHDVEKLPFARSYEPDALNKTLTPGVRQFLDVLSISVLSIPQKVLAPSIAATEIVLTEMKSGGNVFANHGEYVLTIALCGGTIPTQFCKLRFNWTGHSSTSSATLIE